MPDNTFDVVSKVEMPEVSNAVQQTIKEVQQRYDLKDSHSTIQLNEKENKIELQSRDEFKLKAVVEILQAKMVKRHVPLKNLQFGNIIPAAGSTVRQEITLQNGISIETAIQGDFVRVSGRDRDTLQQVIALLRNADFGIETQFINYRTN